jgi:TonB-linked SusC/RagA family outer membrane protein
MEKKHANSHFRLGSAGNLLKKMKLLIAFFFAGLLGASANTYSQATKLSLNLEEVTVKEAFRQIERNSEFVFFYNEDYIDVNRKVNVNVRDEKIETILGEILRGTKNTYKIYDRQIVISSPAMENSPSATKSLTKAEQKKAISGTVKDTKGVLLPGVSVVAKGTTSGVITGTKGEFKLSVPAEATTLVFSFVGMKMQEVKIDGKTNFNIVLEDEVTGLDEVRVTGYSIQKLKHLANSTSSINMMSSVEGKPITQLSQALQGGATGITVTQSSGLPGGDAAIIKIRGISTIGDTNPLVLLDGVPFNIDDVDPTTVESINILKDAAAASIYGSRAANGVIVITTKRGLPGRVTVSYDSYGGIQVPQYLPQFVDAPKYMEMINEARINNGGAATYSPDAIAKTRSGEDPLLYPNTDWRRLIIKDHAFTQNHTIGVTGGNDLARFAVTGSYLDQGGIVGSSAAKRYSLRANTSVTLSNKVSLYLDMNVLKKVQTQNVNYFSEDFGASGGGTAGGGSAYILQLLYYMPPNIVAKFPVREDGYEAYGNFGDMKNPLANIEKGGTRVVWDDDVNVNIQPQWSIKPYLKLKGQYLLRLETNANRIDRDSYTFLDYYTNVVQFTFADNKTNATSRSLYDYSSLILDFNRTFGNHTVYAVGGTAREQEKPDNFQQRNLASYFVKFNYIFKDRYLFESTWRTDGSSLFSEGHKWGSFPSVALGWNAHSEKFLANSHLINKLKPRASYGLLGNNRNVSPYRYQSTISASNGTETVIGNPDITWETISMLDLGVDAGFFNNKLGLTFDWFDKKTDDILLSPPLSLSSGVKTIAVNSGSVRNRGWEIAANFAQRFTNGFLISVNAGYSFYKNEILTLKNGPYLSAENIQKVGCPVGSYYGYRTDGLLQESDIAAGVPRFGSGTPAGPSQVAGDIKYVDVNKDGTIDDKDKVVLGSPEPQGNYFANTRFEYKNFDVEVQINGFTSSKGLYSGKYRVALDATAGTPMTYQTDYWTPENTGAKLPRLTTSPGNNVLMSDYWITNAAFTRVRFIQLGYNFKKQWVSKARLTNARIYLNAQNPFTFTKMKYLDPESRGSETIYPLMQTYTVGLSIKF